MTTPNTGEHPDEGTIHAWLDVALSAADAERIDAHVHGCSACAERVAEARGLIAGAARVVTLLDESPRPTVRATDKSTLWRALRITPMRASIAAVLLVAVGIVMTRGTIANERQSGTMTQLATAPVVVPAAPPSVAEATPVQTPVAAPAQTDSLFASAVRAKVRKDQPARTMEAVREARVAVSPGDTMTRGAAAPDPLAANRVADARAFARASSETTSARADRTRTRFDAPSNSGVAAATAAGRAAEGLAQPMSPRPAVATTASACYRIESADGTTGSWGTASLPFVVAFDSSGITARILRANGQDTEERATSMRPNSDSIVLSLQKIGLTGSLALGRDESGLRRIGVMNSRDDRIPVAKAMAPQQTEQRSEKRTGSINGSTAIAARLIRCPAS